MQAAKFIPTQNSKPMSISEFAFETGISVRKAWQLVADRRIESRRIDKRVIISRKAAEAFWKNCVVPTFDAEAEARKVLDPKHY